MFSENHNLLYINIKDLDVSQVTQMQNMFSNCQSIMFIYFGTFLENSMLDINDIFSGTKDDLIYCIFEGTQKIQESLNRIANTINKCNHSCFNSKKLIPIKKLKNIMLNNLVRKWLIKKI